MIDSAYCRSKKPNSTLLVLINHKKILLNGQLLTEPKILSVNRILTSKYTLLNFLPKNLFYQFRRIGNFYFLITTIIQIIIDSPVSPATSFVPLLFVICTTSIKQAYEDWLRHKADRLTNSKLIQVISKKKINEIKSEDILKGDIIKVREEEEIPCDLIILSSSNSEGFCSITTANLDGETNLKKKFAVNFTKKLINPIDLSNINACIECEEPNCDLYDFSGLLTLNKNGFHTIALGPENLLLRGSRLINTSFIYGVAVYTGNETKMSLNSKVIKMKFSSLEKSINIYLLMFLVILIGFCTSNLFLRYLLVINSEKILSEHWYLKYVFFTNFNLSFKSILSNFFNFFVLYNYLVPISLYVSLEMTRFIGSKMMVMKKNFDPSGNVEDSKLICNCSDMNEDLGQIKYLFSDKTGTLTENVMKFVSCVINDQIYQLKDKTLFKESSKKILEKIELTDNLKFFFICLALCNTVNVKRKKTDKNKFKPQIVEYNEKNFEKYDKIHFEYTADSPDEKALVKTSFFLGIKLISSNKEEYCLNIDGKILKYKILNIIEFDSIRKRMSVIVRDENKNIILICKGAESELIDLIKSKIQKTYSYIENCANQGLRTMVIAYRYLTELEYDKFKKEFDTANNSIKNRNKLLNKSFEKVENNLNLIGATAIEDKLQEDVQKTILDLQKAGVNIWLLTGDKLETAVSVAFSCKLIKKNYDLIFLSRQKNTLTCGEKLTEHWYKIKNSIKFEKINSISFKNNLIYVIKKINTKTEIVTKLLNKIVDFIMNYKKKSNVGLNSIKKNSLIKIVKSVDELVSLKKNFNLKHEIKISKHVKFYLKKKFVLILDGRSLYIALKYHKELFQLICQHCTVTICSRMSPFQKAEVVRMVKNFPSKPITAAIGDGANDVSMIQEANIGFGVIGKEGLQAVRNADFAFSKFKYIKNVMLIDGHFFYERMCYLIHYFFFKSLVFIIPQYLYSHYNMYSGQTLYHGMLLMTYNLFFTATPIFIKSILEEYVPKFFLDEFPELYKTISSNAHMNIKLILKWIILSTLQGFFIFYSAKIIWPSTLSMLNDGKTSGIFSFGLIIFHVVVLVVNLKILIKCRKINGFFIISVLASILSLPAYIYLYSSFKWNFLDDELYGQYNTLIISPSFWLTVFIITFFAILPDIMYSVIEVSFQVRFIKKLVFDKNKKNTIF